MVYRVLTLGLSDTLITDLKEAIQYNPAFSAVLTVQEAGRLLVHQIFHLLIVDLDYLRNIQQSGWLLEIRHISFVPMIVLSDTPEQDTSGMVRLGADICISGKQLTSILADFAYAQLRRYTEYNHYHGPGATETAPFRVGDIFIDPPRRKVRVGAVSINLRPREFSLLLYFMRNPKIVLTSEQICEHAWGMEGSYNQGVSHPVRLLRKAIEPDPEHPVYIETVRRVGYRFTAYHSEICDMC